MAFMMPVMKNNYEIYPGKPRSRKGSTSTTASIRSSRPGSRAVSESEKSNVDIMQLLSTSPPSNSVVYSSSAPSGSTLAARPQRTVRFSRSVSQDSSSSRRSGVSRVSTSSSSSNDTTSDDISAVGSNTNMESSSPKFGSLSKFHSKLIDKLKRKFRMKDEDVCISEDDVTVIRAST